MGVEKGELILYRLRDLMPVYCQHLGGIAVTALSPEQGWREEYNRSLHRVETEIKRTVQEVPELEMPYRSPDEVLERFLKGMFGEAVSNRYKLEKGRFDGKHRNPQ